MIVGLWALAVAGAWEPAGHVWPRRTQPIVWEVADHDAGPLDADTVQDVMRAAMATWLDADTCADVAADDPTIVPENTPAAVDFVHRVSFDDPGDVLEPGLLAFTTPRYDRRRVARYVDGRVMRPVLDVDTIFADGVDWALDDAVAADDCEARVSLTAVATHELGHVWGLAHSCERDEDCAPWLAEATMHWQVPVCDTSDSTLATDDVDGLRSLYGPWVGIACSHALDAEDPQSVSVGEVGTAFACTLSSNARGGLTDVTWTWGDGTTTTDTTTPTHAYDAEGLYDVEVCVEGTWSGCDGWSSCVTRPGAVRVCGVPEPTFTVALDGEALVVRHETPIAVEGCLTSVRWDLVEGLDPSGPSVASSTAWEPDWSVSGAGPWTVVLHAGGPAGTGAAAATVGATGCRVVPTGGGPLVLLGVMSGLVRRRRPRRPGRPSPSRGR